MCLLVMVESVSNCCLFLMEVYVFVGLWDWMMEKLSLVKCEMVFCNLCFRLRKVGSIWRVLEWFIIIEIGEMNLMIGLIVVKNKV